MLVKPVPSDDPNILLPVGVRITCPRCRTFIATTIREVSRLNTLGLDAFKFAIGQAPEHGQGANCKACGAGYIVTDYTKDGRIGMRAHTRDGWVSTDPEQLQRLT